MEPQVGPKAGTESGTKSVIKRGTNARRFARGPDFGGFTIQATRSAAFTIIRNPEARGAVVLLATFASGHAQALGAL